MRGPRYTLAPMAPAEPTRKRPGGPPGPKAPSREIPDKLYFRIGEVARLCEVPAYVLRFWESEFPQLKPNKGGTGQRLYRRRDVEMALRIKTLLYDEGYTIPGARQAFKSEARTGKDGQLGLAGVNETVDVKPLQALHKELRDLHALLSRPPGSKSSTVQPIRAPRPVAAKPQPPAPMQFPKPVTLKPRPEDRTDSLFDLDPDGE